MQSDIPLHQVSIWNSLERVACWVPLRKSNLKVATVKMGQTVPCLKARQDGGDGHVGTVVEVGHIGNRLSPDKTVIVQWDNGRRTNYRVGYKGAYDLLVFDGAPAGVKHINKRCDGCGRRGIKGTRWQCTECSDYDLCNRCYMEDVHDVEHTFRRFLTNRSTGVLIPKTRSRSKRCHSSGIFRGAKVVRGCDWIWGNQDGGGGEVGTVAEIRGWQDESDRSVASVNFVNGTGSNVYRVGHRGKVDLKYTTPSQGPPYYKEHLPVLGKDDSGPCPFEVGDKVRVTLSIDVLRQMQKGHGGWNPKMAQLIGLVGTVHRITQANDVRVQYPPLQSAEHTNGGSTSSNVPHGDNNRWTLNPAALTKYNFAVDDHVKVIDDCAKVKSLQSSDHGNWNDKMKECLGQTGIIVEIYHDGDVRVEFPRQGQWTFNPACVVSLSDASRIVPPTPIATEEMSISQELVQKIATGDVQAVKRILQQHPHMINSKHRQIQGRTALQVAAYKGQSETVQFLLSKGAKISVTDDEGDGALHFAMFSKSNQTARNECVGLLLDNATPDDVNLLNAKKQSPLHVAVILRNMEWAKKILSLNCNVNAQEQEGDTAAHCCVINCDNPEMLNLLLAQRNFNQNLVNKKDFNILHTAAMKGQICAVETILEKFPDLPSRAKADGITALHLSVLNGHENVSQLLIRKCPQLVNKQDKSGQTPVYVAASEGDAVSVTMLVNSGANLRILTTEGKSCIQAAIEKFNNTAPSGSNELSLESGPSTTLSSSNLFTMVELLPSSSDWSEVRHVLKRNNYVYEDCVYLGIACYLICAIGAHSHIDDDFIHAAIASARDEKVRSILEEFQRNSSTIILPSEFSSIVTMNEQLPRHRSVSSPTTRTIKENFVTCLDDDTPSSITERIECRSCGEEVASVIFRPCGHKIVCADCCVRMKKCIQCEATIVDKVDEDGNEITLISIEQQEQLLELERKVRELQESNQCIICMENQRDTALKCGHRFCQKCARTFKKQCPICRKPITGTIHLY